MGNSLSDLFGKAFGGSAPKATADSATVTLSPQQLQATSDYYTQLQSMMNAQSGNIFWGNQTTGGTQTVGAAPPWYYMNTTSTVNYTFMPYTWQESAQESVPPIPKPKPLEADPMLSEALDVFLVEKRKREAR